MIRALDVYAFEDIVFRSSQQEGQWELETLLNLHALYQRDLLRDRLHQDEELRRHTQDIRSLEDIPKAEETSPQYEKEVRRLSHTQWYEEGRVINPLHLPLEPGDIFQKKNTKKYFMLLAQPCSLVIRGATGKRTAEEAVLVEIASKPTDDPQLCYPLNTFCDAFESECYLRFDRTHTVRLCFLDLCVFQESGEALLGMGQDCPDLVLPGWNKRYQFIRKEADRLLHWQEKLLKKSCSTQAATEAVVRELKLTTGGLFQPEVCFEGTTRKVSFPIQRVARLCRPRAVDALTKYAHSISRAAFDIDLRRRR